MAKTSDVDVNQQGFTNEQYKNLLRSGWDKSLDGIMEKDNADIETLEILQSQYSNYEILFMMGTDNLKGFRNWKRPDEFLDNFRIYVLTRDDDNIEKIIENDDLLKRHKDSFIKAKIQIVSNLSSTFVRDKIKNGKSIKYLSPDEVIEYINKNNLYK